MKTLLQLSLFLLYDNLKIGPLINRQCWFLCVTDRHKLTFISGEVSENTTHAARELGIHYFAAGHHATERYGAKALGEHLAQEFSLDVEFIDIDNPV